MESGAAVIDGDGVVVELAELDAIQALEFLTDAFAQERRAEANQLQIAAHWADLHSGDALDVNTSALPGRERARTIAGDGTPAIGELCVGEFAAVAGLSTTTGSKLIADALDLRHRYPLTWARLCRYEVAVWICRRIANQTRHLSFEAAQYVDAAVAPYLSSLPPGRLFTLVDAKIIEADPEDAEARAKLAQANRFVRTGRTTDCGIKALIARAEAGDVIMFTALCDRVAQILGLKGDSDSLEVRRSKAIGMIASPIRTIALLAEYEGRKITEPPEPTPAQQENHVQSGPTPAGTAWTAEDHEPPEAQDPPADAGLGGQPVPLSPESNSSSDRCLIAESPGGVHPGTQSLDDADPIREPGPGTASGSSAAPGRGIQLPHGPGLRGCAVLKSGSELTPFPDGVARVRPARSSDSRRSVGPEPDPSSESADREIPEPDVRLEPLLEPPDDSVLGEADLHPAEIEPYLSVDCAAELQKILDRHRINPRDLLPKTVVYLHVDRDTLVDNSGAVRVEDVGPITAAQFKHWIRGKHLTITPVIDPNNTPPADAYEATDRLKDALRMITPAEAFPYGTSTGRDIDHDHVIPYRPPPAGPPGQTSLGNLNRLGRRSHRYKTHGGWQVRMPEPGTTIWRSPNGWYFLTNQAGTHPLGNGDYARTIWDTMINDFTATRYPHEDEDSDEDLAG